MSPSTTIMCWHGSQKWSHHPQVQPARKGRYECGPGMYLTTSRQTAAKYAKGSGSLVVVELSPHIRWLEDAHLTLEQMLQALDVLPRVRHRAAIEQDLRQAAQRHPDGQLMACYLVNLCVNHEALSGEAGPALARWLTDQGIDASLDNKNANEDWVVVFNPAIIQSARKINAKQADEHPWTWPKVKDQLAAGALQETAQDVTNASPKRSFSIRQ